MTVCVGCGLFDPDDGVNPVRVATSGTWGGAGLAFADPDTNGAPIYCDGASELRGPPEHTSSVFNDTATTAVGTGFAASAISGTAHTITLDNPSSVRSCTYKLDYKVKFTVAITASGFAFAITVVQDGGSPATLEAEYWGTPAVDPYSVEQILPDWIAGTLPPGGSTTIEITPKIDATSGGGSGTLSSQTIKSSAQLVTI